jgi:hypothetical protein
MSFGKRNSPLATRRPALERKEAIRRISRRHEVVTRSNLVQYPHPAQPPLCGSRQGSCLSTADSEDGVERDTILVEMDEQVVINEAVR